MQSQQHEILVYAPVAVVWSLLTDIEEWPRWQVHIQHAKVASPLGVGAAFRWKSHGRTYHCQLQSLKVNERLEWSGRALGLSAQWEWLLTPTHRGVLVQVKERCEGWMVKWFGQNMQTHMDTLLNFWLSSLKAEAERISDAYQSVS